VPEEGKLATGTEGPLSTNMAICASKIQIGDSGMIQER